MRRLLAPAALLVAACSAGPPPPAPLPAPPPAPSPSVSYAASHVSLLDLTDPPRAIVARPVASSSGARIEVYDIVEHEELGTVSADEGGVTRETVDHLQLWSVRLRVFPGLVGYAASRALAVGTNGTMLTGASDGSLIALDFDGQPLFQLGVRGAVSGIKARLNGSFEVTTSAGVAIVGPDGIVHSDATTQPNAPLARPTIAYRAHRAGPAQGLDLTYVFSAVALAPDDVWALVLRAPGSQALAHYTGGSWRDLGAPWARSGKPASDKVWVNQLARGPDGGLLLIAHRTVQQPPPAICEPWPADLTPVVLERAGAGFRERNDIAAAAVKIPPESWMVPGGGVTRYAAGAGGREIVWHEGFCMARGVPAASRPGDHGSNPASKDDTKWSHWAWEIKGSPRMARPLTFAGETLWGADRAEDGNGQLVRAGKVVLDHLPAGPLPPVHALWASGEDDVWALSADPLKDDTDVVTHWDGKTFTSTPSPLKGARFVGGTARDDVWLAGPIGVARFDGERWWRIAGAFGGVSVVTGAGRGDLWIGGSSGLWHVTQNPEVQLDLEGTPPRPPPASAPSRPLAIASTDPLYRLERVVLEVDGGPPLQSALGIAEGPAGVLWLHDGHRIVEHDGARTRLLHETPPLERLACQRCLAPAGAGEGAVLIDALRGVTAGRVSPELPSLPALLAVSRAPSGALWAVSAGDDDSLPHAMVQSGRGLRLVTGLPAAAYADVAARADDDVWMAGGLSAQSDSVRIWPAGEGTLVRFDGRAFTRHRSPDGALLSVTAVGPGEAWAVGMGGGVVHAVAGSVEAFHLARGDGARLPVTLRAAAAAGPREVWMAGDGSTLLRWDGKALRSIDASAAGTDAALTAVIAPGARSGWVVGPSGIWRLVRVT